jgi:hypothetical protein
MENPISKLIEKEINEYYQHSCDKKLKPEDIRNGTEKHIAEILKTCSELGSFYAILKGLLCGVYDMSDKDKTYLPESIKELFTLYEKKLLIVAYESVSLVNNIPSDEVESE